MKNREKPFQCAELCNGFNAKRKTSSISYKAYYVNLTLLHKPTDKVYDMEVKFKTEMDEYYYKPKISFIGSTTECYTKLSEALQKLIE